MLARLVSVVTPTTAMSPLSVIVPLAVAERLPAIVEAPIARGPLSLSVTSFAWVTPTDPVNTLARLSVTSPAAPAASVVLPPTVRIPLWVMSVAAVSERLPESDEAAMSSEFVSLSVASPADTIVTAPTKSFAASRVMSLAPAVSVVVPPTVITPPPPAPLVVGVTAA